MIEAKEEKLAKVRVRRLEGPEKLLQDPILKFLLNSQKAKPPKCLNFSPKSRVLLTTNTSE